MAVLSKILDMFSKNKNTEYMNASDIDISSIENKIILSMLDTLRDLNSRFNKIIELNKKEAYVADKNELNNLRLNESKELLEIMKDLIDLTNNVKDYIYEYVKEIEQDPYMNIDQKYYIKNQIKSQLVYLKKKIDALFVEMEIILQKI